MPQSPAPKRRPALRAGLLFGTIIGIVTLADAIIQSTTGSIIFPGDFFSTATALIDFQSAGVAGIASGVQLLVLLVLSFVMGRGVAQQTGRVGPGVATGLIAGTVGTLIGFVGGIVVIIVLFSLGQPLQAGGAAFQLGDAGGLLFDTAFGLQTFAPFYIGFGAGFAAIGGEIGARAYRKAHPDATPPLVVSVQPPPFAMPLPALAGISNREAEREITHPALRNGLLFGVILAVGLLAGTVIQERTGTLSTPEDVFFAALQLIGFLTAGVVVYVELLSLLALSFVAGIRAARQSGKLGSGVLAGLFVGTVGSVLGYVIGSAVIVGLLPLVVPLPQSHASTPDFGLLIAANLFGAMYVVTIWAMLGGMLGLLGGLIGARSARKALADTSPQEASTPQPAPDHIPAPPQPTSPDVPMTEIP